MTELNDTQVNEDLLETQVVEEIADTREGEKTVQKCTFLNRKTIQRLSPSQN